MQILATGNKAPKTDCRACQRARGFTLLELLVVLLVVALILSLANLGFSSGGREIRLQAQLQTLADLADYVLDEAQATGIDRGLRLEYVNDTGREQVQWRWLERQGQSWQAVTTDVELLQTERLPDTVEVVLLLEDLPAVELPLASDLDNQLPQLQLYADGETTPGTLEVRQRDNGRLLWVLEWDLLGRFALKEQAGESR